MLLKGIVSVNEIHRKTLFANSSRQRREGKQVCIGAKPTCRRRGATTCMYHGRDTQSEAVTVLAKDFPGWPFFWVNVASSPAQSRLLSVNS